MGGGAICIPRHDAFWLNWVDVVVVRVAQLETNLGHSEVKMTSEESDAEITFYFDLDNNGFNIW